MMYDRSMRTTISLDDDTAAAVERLRRKGVGLSQAVNELIRDGLRRKPAASPFRQRSAPLGIRVDVSNISEALEQLDSPPSA